MVYKSIQAQGNTREDFAGVSNLDQQIPNSGRMLFFIAVPYRHRPASAVTAPACSAGCIACRHDISTSVVRRLHPVTALSSCDERMSPARIAPGTSAFDIRTFAPAAITTRFSGSLATTLSARFLKGGRHGGICAP